MLSGKLRKGADVKGFLIFFLIPFLVLFAIYSGPEIIGDACKHRWEDSGLNSRYRWGPGCMVQVDGRWIPEANVQISPPHSN
jgi:hypothetical protein